MKTSNYQYQFLLAQATTLYKSEKELSGIFDVLKANTEEVSVQEGIMLEAEENRRQCTRLEGLLEVLDRAPYKNGNHDEIAIQNFNQQFSMMLKRIAFKHADYGYRTAISVALAQGKNEVVNLFRHSLKAQITKPKR